MLTLKSDLLSRLTTEGKLGVNATLTAGFSEGADWKLNIIQYNTPVLNDAKGTTSAFAIPVTFGGDQLATMEATYANGENAGPQNWTSFKEFAYTFSPDYEGNVIELKPNFFNETKDGEIHLKFHFWSGTVIEYTLTKKGTIVEGSSS